MEELLKQITEKVEQLEAWVTSQPLTIVDEIEKDNEIESLKKSIIESVELAYRIGRISVWDELIEEVETE